MYNVLDKLQFNFKNIPLYIKDTYVKLVHYMYTLSVSHAQARQLDTKTSITH